MHAHDDGILAMDTFSPITDNAGIFPDSTSRKGRARITDRLDAVGNTTKALTKGYASPPPRWPPSCSSAPTSTRST
jgi:Na+/H+-translocating membrane pyrophosphatase